MDMNASYDRLIKTVFPNAQVVYDRFYIVKHLNDTLNYVRIKVYNQLRHGNRQEQKQARRLKHYWRLFLQDEKHLNQHPYYEGRYFHQIVNSLTILNLLLQYNEELAATYSYIHLLKRAYNHRDYSNFFHLLKLTPAGVSAQTAHRCHHLLHYRAGIELGFKKKRFSNGRTEGINNRIKMIKRVAFGYQCFETFRARIYLIIGKQICQN